VYAVFFRANTPFYSKHTSARRQKVFAAELCAHLLYENIDQILANKL